MEFDPASKTFLAGTSAKRRWVILHGGYPDGVAVEIRRAGSAVSPLTITIRQAATVTTTTLFTGIEGVRQHLGAHGLPAGMGDWTVSEWGRRR